MADAGLGGMPRVPLPPEAERVALRLTDGIDADLLGEHLALLWRGASGRRRAAAPIELSVVETCGRSRDERERDAMRLLRAEAQAALGAAPGALRATLVSLSAREHLLLLASAPGASAAGLIAAICADLSRLYPMSTLALG